MLPTSQAQHRASEAQHCSAAQEAQPSGPLPAPDVNLESLPDGYREQVKQRQSHTGSLHGIVTWLACQVTV